jgi:hypothetical protein
MWIKKTKTLSVLSRNIKEPDTMRLALSGGEKCGT